MAKKYYVRTERDERGVVHHQFSTIRIKSLIHLWKYDRQYQYTLFEVEGIPLERDTALMQLLVMGIV